MEAGELSKEGDVIMWDVRKLALAMTVRTGRAAATNAASAGNRSKQGRSAETHTGEATRPSHTTPYIHHKQTHSLFNEHGNSMVIGRKN